MRMPLCVDALGDFGSRTAQKANKVQLARLLIGMCVQMLILSV